MEWLFAIASEDQRRYAIDYLRLRDDEGYGWGVIAGAWGSVCNLAMAPLQDVLGLGGDARMNLPGSMGEHNWSWRVRREAFNDNVAQKPVSYTHLNNSGHLSWAQRCHSCQRWYQIRTLAHVQLHLSQMCIRDRSRMMLVRSTTSPWSF